MIESNSHDEIRKLLDGKYKGYVLLTCDHPKKDGSMCVEMSHGEDRLISEYLLSSALSYFDEDEKMSQLC